MKLKVHWQILIALALGIFAGAGAGVDSQILGVTYYHVFAFVGDLFLQALKMLVVPLIVSSMVTGVATLGDGAALGRLGAKVVLYYLFTSLAAILVGLVVVNAVAPGIVDGQPAKELIGLEADASQIAAQVEGRGSRDLAEVLLRLVPANVVEAASQGDMLGLIFFSLLFGVFMARLRGPAATTLLNFWQAVFSVMMDITNWVLKFAPIGVFALVAKVVASTGFSAFVPLAAFVLSVLVALGIHMFGTLPLLLRIIGRVSPMRHFKAMAPALLTAFSTSSSSATLPMTMKCVEQNAGVSNRTSSFVLPLGATVNMDGTALYECVAAMFIAQAYGVEMGGLQQFVIILTALLTSVGVAGIPAASLVAITIILGAIGLPAEGIGLILAVDRILDMCRTTVNVFSDSCGAVVIARSEGEAAVLAESAARAGDSPPAGGTRAG